MLGIRRIRRIRRPRRSVDRCCAASGIARKGAAGRTHTAGLAEGGGGGGAGMAGVVAAPTRPLRLLRPTPILPAVRPWGALGVGGRPWG